MIFFHYSSGVIAIAETKTRNTSLLAKIVITILFCLFLAGMLSVALTSADGHGEFADYAELIMLSSAVEQYRQTVGEIPIETGTADFTAFVARVYGKEVSEHPQVDSLDRNELLTFLLDTTTWPIEKPIETPDFIFYEFYDHGLMDNDGDGWLEYRFKDNRLFLLREGEPCLWNEETNRYQFPE